MLNNISKQGPHLASSISLKEALLMSIVLSFRGLSSPAKPAAAKQVTAKRSGVRIGQKVVSALWA